jgi:hypothetical protein
MRLRPIPPRVLALVTMALSFWILTALNRAQISGPTSSRYVYVGALIAVLLAAELMRGVSLPWRARLLLGVVAAAAIVSNAGTLRDGAKLLRGSAEAAKADTGALEAGRSLVKRDYVATHFPGYPLVIVRAGPYFAATKANGSPAATPAEIATKSEDARRIADAELINLHQVGLTPGAGTQRRRTGPTVDSVAGGTVMRHGPCLTFLPAGVNPGGVSNAVDLPLPPQGLRLTAGGGAVTVSMRRFADGFQPVGTLAASASAVLHIGPDLAPQQWHARIAPTAGATVCGLG